MARHSYLIAASISQIIVDHRKLLCDGEFMKDLLKEHHFYLMTFIRTLIKYVNEQQAEILLKTELKKIICNIENLIPELLNSGNYFLFV